MFGYRHHGRLSDISNLDIEQSGRHRHKDGVKDVSILREERKRIVVTASGIWLKTVQWFSFTLSLQAVVLLAHHQLLLDRRLHPDVLLLVIVVSRAPTMRGTMYARQRY